MMPTRVAITRPQKDASAYIQALQEIGVEPVLIPTIEISPVMDTCALDLVIANLKRYNWLIFTSANAVTIFFDRMDTFGEKRPPQDLKIAAIGSKTAACLEARGVTPNFIPQKYFSEALVSGFGDLREQWVLIPTSDIAPDTLPCEFQKRGATVHRITIYQTVPASPDPASLSALRSGVDIITFTSSSSARNFVRMVSNAGMDPYNLPGNPRIACIGPKTAEDTRSAGFNVEIIASRHTVDGLVEAIQSHITGSGTGTHDHAVQP